jgi:uncharacterized protein (DUF1778 family)
MGTIKKEKARFDTRLPKEQKFLFEKAARLGGYRSLTDFIILTVQKRANEIIHDHERIIASQKDQEVFFDALINAPEPNSDLLAAKDEFNKQVSK